MYKTDFEAELAIRLDNIVHNRSQESEVRSQKSL